MKHTHAEVFIVVRIRTVTTGPDLFVDPAKNIGQCFINIGGIQARSLFLASCLKAINTDKSKELAHIFGLVRYVFLT